jgi:endo-1,4-beta-D-glucanase Y
MYLTGRARLRAMIAAAACTPLVAGIAGCGGSQPSSHHGPAAAFLRHYVRSDGRVVRPDQGGDTVSEGQAYAMLLAETTGDPAEFRRIWDWTRTHLQLADRLFAYHANAAGHVVSRQPASDADLLIAWALLRYHGPGAAALHHDGRQVAAAILAHEVTRGPGGTPILTAGPWATGRPATLDPSYWSLTALQGLGQLTGSPQWRRLATGAVTITRQLTRDGRTLPPDWAELTAAGALRPEPAPGGGQPQTQFGPDAQRTVVWFAASCSQDARELAGRWWNLLRSGGREGALALRPDGSVLDGTPAALPYVASAAAAKAAGDQANVSSLLRHAAARQRSQPTYYGGAWNALGPAMLTSRSLSSCG